VDPELANRLRSALAGPQRWGSHAAIEDAPLDDLADLIVYDGALQLESESSQPAHDRQTDVSQPAPLNDYPLLPTSGELDAAVEETDATLRMMREHLVSDEPSRRPRRISRLVTVSAGICAVGAVALLAADTQLGFAGLPRPLGL